MPRPDDIFDKREAQAFRNPEPAKAGTPTTIGALPFSQIRDGSFTVTVRRTDGSTADIRVKKQMVGGRELLIDEQGFAYEKRRGTLFVEPLDQEGG